MHFSDRRPDSVRDLYQEIVRTLWEAWPNYRGESSIDTWVRRIAINVAVDEIRSIAKRPQFVHLEDWMYATISDENGNNHTDYYRLISALEPEERELVYLRLDGLSLKDIAEQLSATEDAIKQRFRRLRQKIDKLKQQEYEE
ncbi:MAG: RNA polymerase sigma factor [Bacteroidales bacterium]|nr:RNA polymerase sigma factor [Bacteroidales bacterium]